MDLVVLILAAWRLTSLLSSEAGPFAILDRLRHAAGVRYDSDGIPFGLNELARGLVCPWCLSVWVGVGFGLVWLLWPSVTMFVALPLAISGGAVLVHTIIERLE